MRRESLSDRRAVGQMDDRKLGFGVTEGNIGYELAFASAKNAGIQFIELPQQWDEIETEQGSYTSPFVAMANEVYPQLGNRNCAFDEPSRYGGEPSPWPFGRSRNGIQVNVSRLSSNGLIGQVEIAQC